MALDLEKKIMKEIGLGNHYDWHNGSMSSKPIRIEAANKLEQALQEQHDNGAKIMPPNMELIEILKEISISCDKSDYELTKTWIAASSVIRIHINAAHNPDGFKSRGTIESRKHLENNYLKRARESNSPTELFYGSGIMTTKHSK